MPKCDFSKAALQLYWNRLWHGCSPVNLLHIFRSPFPKNISGWLLLKKMNQIKVKSFLKEDHHALGLFVEKHREKYEVFEHPLTTFPLAISAPEENTIQSNSNQKSSIFREFISLSYQTLMSVKWIQITLPFMMQWLLLAQIHRKNVWQSLFQALPKTFRLQEAEETITVIQ